MNNLKEYKPLPTSEDELDAQIDEFQSAVDEAAKPTEPQPDETNKPQQQRRTGGGGHGAASPEDDFQTDYIEPNTDFIMGAYWVISLANPYLAAFGIRELDGQELLSVSESMGEVAAHYPAMNLGIKDPKKKSFAALAMCIGAIAGPRIIEAMSKSNMRDVTPKAEGEGPQGDLQGAPLNG